MDYSKTINLPSGDFPMRANLPKREPEMLKIWEDGNIYEEILKRREGADIYILHDGPPYANGHIHMGTALNKILKDIIIKHKTMMGYKALYVPGWDCHGLPIELHVMKNLGEQAKDASPVKIRYKCRDYANKFLKIQMQEFKRLGVFGDFKNPYITMAPAYESKIVEIFGRIFQEGYVYRSKRPIYWCPTCTTALAEAEVEYDDHTSASIYVKFKVDPNSVNIDGVDKNNLYVVIWTTTPWTLPANLALSFHPEFSYSAYRFGEEYYIVADGLIYAMEDIIGREKSEKIPISKSQIEEFVVYHPFIDRESKIIFGTHVTLEQGTGVVHTAPGHGYEDYIVGLEYGIETYSPVDYQGKFTSDFPQMEGVNVFDANPMVVDLLKEKNALVFRNDVEHSYPHCWRCKKPLIYRATEQWFMRVDHNNLREIALKAVSDTEWIPSWGETRFGSMIESRGDWCLSRQRSWGVPIPSFICKKCKRNLMSSESILFFAELSLEKGLDSWYTEDIMELVPEGTKCPDCQSNEFEKEFDILDVWFDSGVSHFAVLDEWEEHRWPSDIYLEGSDQHRGWFQSSFWTALALRKRAPYNTVLTHGFVLDENSRIMSKSDGNAIAPSELINKYGADIIRMWVSSEDYRNDVRIGFDMMKQTADSYRKIRNTFKFILGNLADFSLKDKVEYDKLPDIDKWILHRLNELSQQIIEAYERFEFHMVYRKILNFCSIELSNIYFDISKDILYVEIQDSLKRRATQTVLYEIYQTFVALISPILSFTTEEIWKYNNNTDSIHMQTYHKLDKKFNNPEIGEKMEAIVNIKKDVLKILELKRKEKIIGTSLEADIKLFVKDDKVRNWISEMKDENIRFFQVSNVELLTEAVDELMEFENSFIGFEKTKGVKCIRCWNYTLELGKDQNHPELCPRCADIMKINQ